MEHIDPQQIAAALHSECAGWTRVGLTAPSQRIREQAAEELALTIIDALEGSAASIDTRQMALSL